MKVNKLKPKATIEVGDYIQSDNWTGKTWFKVVRVTAKFAIVKWNKASEGKVRREVDGIGYAHIAGDTDIWSQTKYTAWRPVQQDVSKQDEVKG